MSTRVWISGAGGMMGSHLLQTVLATDDDALGTYYNPTIDLDDLKGLPLQEVDVTDWCSVFDSLKSFRPDLIFHLAAQSYPVVSWQRPIETITTNVVGTITLFEAVRRLNLDSRVIVACSSAEYGVTVAGDKPLTEDTPLLPLHPYGVSKVAQDLLAYQYHKSFGLDTVRARIFNCTGTRKVGDALSDFVRRAVWLERHPEENAMRVGNLKTRRAIVDVRDLNAALLALARQGKSGEVYNVSGDIAYLMGSVVERVLARSTRRDLKVVRDPALMRPTDEPVIWGDTTRLKAATGWRQGIPLEKTIADMLAFWRGRPPRGPEGNVDAGAPADLVATTVGSSCT